MSEPPSAEPALLTVIAAHDPSQGGSTDPSLDEYPDAVEKLLGGGGLGSVARASSISRLNAAVKAAAAAHPSGQICLQLVAHGEAGRLSLAEAWTGKYHSPGEFYALDGNPSLLDNLAQWKGRLSRVILAACDVGNPTASIRAVGGTTLLFTLEQLWGCPVVGATTEVNVDMFDKKTGLFTGPARRWNDAQLQAHRKLEPVPPSKITLSLQKLVALRQRAQTDLVTLDCAIPKDLGSSILDTYSAPGKHAGSGMAAARFTASIATDNKTLEGTAALIFDCRCLAVGVAGPVDGFTKFGERYYGFYDAYSDGAIQNVIQNLTQLAAGPPAPAATPAAAT